MSDMGGMGMLRASSFGLPPPEPSPLTDIVPIANMATKTKRKRKIDFFIILVLVVNAIDIFISFNQY